MPDPYCLAMILCDSVHVDKATGKQTILGTFSTFGSTRYPARISLAIYYAITDAEGEIPLTFRVVDSKHGFEDDIEPVFSMEFMVRSPSPLAVVEGHFGLANGILPAAGVYHCELLTGDSVLMSRRLVAIELTGAKE